jgi:hypothetical protein
VVLKSGERHTGRNIRYRFDRREVAVRTNQNDEPRVPVDQVAYVDFGGTPDPGNLGLSGSQEGLVMRDGSVHKGQIIELGHTNPSDESSEFLVIYRTEGGEERRIPSRQVARVYFAGGGGGGGGSAVTPPVDNVDVTVPGRPQWTATGLNIRRGEWITINASGEVRIGGGVPPASPSGSGRLDPASVLPRVPTATLIGRIGNSPPFVIGSSRRFQAPAAGLLFLGVNDSNYEDNEGSFQIEILRDSRPRR